MYKYNNKCNYKYEYRYNYKCHYRYNCSCNYQCSYNYIERRSGRLRKSILRFPAHPSGKRKHGLGLEAHRQD